MIEFASNIDFAQAANTRLYVQIGTLGVFIGRGDGYAARLEICTPNYWFHVRPYKRSA